MGRLILLCWLLFSAGCAATAPSGKGTAEPPAQPLFRFYDEGLNHLASVRSGTCPMHPSCSEYSRRAFRKHGLVRGWWMTFDRLLRCGRDELDRSPRVLVQGAWKVYDPVSRNDHWWYDPPEAPAPPSRRPPDR